MALAPAGVEAEPGDKITRLIRHLWHTSGSFFTAEGPLGVAADKTRSVSRTLQLWTRTSSADSYWRSRVLSVFDWDLFVSPCRLGRVCTLAFWLFSPGFWLRACVEPGIVRNWAVCSNSIVGLRVYSLIDVHWGTRGYYYSNWERLTVDSWWVPRLILSPSLPSPTIHAALSAVTRMGTLE